MAEGATLAAPLVGKVVAPGDAILRLPEEGEVRIGAGLQPQEQCIVSHKCGVLRQTKGGKLWIEGRQKRYIPAEEDLVIGIVVDRIGENFIVDIGGPFNAQLSMLAFEDATRRNRPNIHNGDAIYARVVTANRDMDPVLSCVDAAGRASGFGPLKGGLISKVTVSWARALLAKPPPRVLALLGKALQFEVAIGLNGRVWVDAPSIAATIAVSRALQAAELEEDAAVDALVRDLTAGVPQQQEG